MPSVCPAVGVKVYSNTKIAQNYLFHFRFYFCLQNLRIPVSPRQTQNHSYNNGN